MSNLQRFQALDERDINKETFVEPCTEAGLTVADSPYDPTPSLRIEDGRVVELDGRLEADFDTLDTFIARHGIDLAVAPEAMALDSLHVCPHARRYQHPPQDVVAPRNGMYAGEIGGHHAPYECTRNDERSVKNAGTARALPIRQHVDQSPGKCRRCRRQMPPKPLCAGFLKSRQQLALHRQPFNALAILVGAQTGAAV
jgi:propanediol dehydratase large subunit